MSAAVTGFGSSNEGRMGFGASASGVIEMSSRSVIRFSSVVRNLVRSSLPWVAVSR